MRIPAASPPQGRAEARGRGAFGSVIITITVSTSVVLEAPAELTPHLTPSLSLPCQLCRSSWQTLLRSSRSDARVPGPPAAKRRVSAMALEEGTACLTGPL